MSWLGSLWSSVATLLADRGSKPPEQKPPRFNSSKPAKSHLSKRTPRNLGLRRDLVVTLDPGHGGDEQGAKYGDIVESDYTLSLARYVHLRVAHSYEPISIQLTRSANKTMTLEQRGQMANLHNSALVISVHVNSGPPVLNRSLCFVRPGDRVGFIVAETISRCMPYPLNRSRGGVHVTVNSDAEDAKWLRRAHNVVSVFHPRPTVLVEVGYASNPSDNRALLAPAIQSGIVSAIFSGIDHFRYLKEAKHASEPVA